MDSKARLVTAQAERREKKRRKQSSWFAWAPRTGQWI
jgi:hypothetical protein